MSDLFLAKIDAVDRKAGFVSLTLTLHNPDPAYPDDIAAALFLLIESAENLDPERKKAMGAEGYGVEQRVDHDWLFENAARYVAEFDLVDSGLPFEEACAFVLRVTDPKWIAHLRKGSQWGSTCPII